MHKDARKLAPVMRCVGHNMMIKAKKVLDDCRLALAELETAISSGSKELARIRWFTCLVLLRAVGHVLDKVDLVFLNSEKKTKSDAIFAQMKRESIFDDFIEKERNLIVKEYTSLVDAVEKEKTFNLVTEGGDRIVTEDGDLVIISSFEECIEKIDGFSKGSSPCQIISNAIEWWEGILGKYEREIFGA